MDGFDPGNDEWDRRMLFEVTGMRLFKEEFHDQDSSESLEDDENQSSIQTIDSDSNESSVEDDDKDKDDSDKDSNDGKSTQTYALNP